MSNYRLGGEKNKSKQWLMAAKQPAVGKLKSVNVRRILDKDALKSHGTNGKIIPTNRGATTHPLNIYYTHTHSQCEQC